MDTLTAKEELMIAHNNDWKNCLRCDLGCKAHKHVLYWQNKKVINRLDMLFIGEGPGQGEDTTGIPFFGPSGQLLRKAINKSLLKHMTYAFTNLVACRPTDEDDKNRQPTSEEIISCQPRLVEVIKIQKPKMIIAVGSVAKIFSGGYMAKSQYNGRFFSIQHPAFILRESQREGSTAMATYDKTLRDLIRHVRSLR